MTEPGQTQPKGKRRRFGCLGILILALAVGWMVGYPAYIESIYQMRMMEISVHHRSVVVALQLYAEDYEGDFPAHDAEGRPFENSTDAFRQLIAEDYIGLLPFLYISDDDEAPTTAGPVALAREANRMIYVSNQRDVMPGDSPLIADRMESPGVYGSNHPWLKLGQATVGYVGGYVRFEDLSSNKPGATVRGPQGSGIDDIFQEAVVAPDGAVSGGYLAVPRENILLP